MILITGGLGYLGSRIAEYLLKSGYKIKLATSRTDPKIPIELSNCEIVTIDLLDIESLKKSCENVSTIIHLAALNTQACAKDPEQALLINGLGTLKLLKAASKIGVSKFIYFSTAHVYGAPLEGNISENSLTNPLHPYSITHRLAEDYLNEYSQSGKMSGVTFRLSNAFGAPILKDSDCWMLVANDLTKQVVTDNVMQIRSNIRIQRDFVPITDVCKAVEFILKSSLLKNYDVFNVGSGYTMTLEDMAVLIADRSDKVLGIKPEIKFSGKGCLLEKYRKLHYSTKKLLNLGCVFENNINHEIDNLLLSCIRWYK